MEKKICYVFTFVILFGGIFAIILISQIPDRGREKDISQFIHATDEVLLSVK